MRPYFESMAKIGKPLSPAKIKETQENVTKIKEIEQELSEAREGVKTAGIPAKKINERGQLTVWQRIEYLVDRGTWCQLHSIFNPQNNEEGSTGVVNGLGKINGKWGRS